MRNIRLFGTDSFSVYTVIGLVAFSMIMLFSYTSNANNNLSINNSQLTLDVTTSISNYNGFGVSSPTANDGYIDITITGGTQPYTFIWSNGESTQDLYNLCGGNYGVYIVDFVGAEFSSTFTITEPAIQVISLPFNWSIMSTYILPVGLGIDNVFASIINDIEVVKDGNGNAFWPQYFVNMIGNMKIGEGYMVKTNSACELSIMGTVVVPEDEIISLPSSWSILGYLRTNPASIIDMLMPITNDIEIVKDYLGMVYWPSMNLNLIGDMIPGEGYQINMISAQTFYYPENDEEVVIVSCPPTVTDYDGNIYSTVQIGDQCWMAENLKSTHYADGTSMVDGTNVGNVSSDYTTKYVFDYNDNPLNSNTYGKLYSWAAMLDGNLCGSLNLEDRQGVCPTGWHVPDNNDWTVLQGTVDTQYDVSDSEWLASGDLGSDIGSNLKSNLSGSWSGLNLGVTNSSGFSALPGGYRLSTGAFIYQGNNSYFWSSQANCQFYGWYRSLSYNKTTIHKNFMNKGVALSVRCIKD